MHYCLDGGVHFKYFVEYPKFLSIDIEGVDLPVLKTLDFKSIEYR